MDKKKYFLVKCDNEWIDINSGIQFREYTDKSFDQCQHGLCKKLNSIVTKRAYKSRINPNLFIATSEKPLEFKSITIQFLDAYKKNVKWTFDSICINECIEAMNEEIGDRQIAIRLGCAKKLIPTLKRKIEIQCLGDENGRTNKSADTARNRVGNIKGVSGISGH